MKNRISLRSIYSIAFILLGASALSQNIKQEKMEQLSFLVGEWVGTTTSLDNGTITKQGAAYEKISYDLDSHLLVIELNTEFLQLHTIITYNEEDEKYYYHRFSKDGAAIYPAEFKEGQLIVWKNEQTRFFFGRTPEGDFLEYGEKLVNGKWTRYFEDRFKNTE